MDSVKWNSSFVVGEMSSPFRSDAREWESLVLLAMLGGTAGKKAYAPEHLDEIFKLFGRINPAEAFPGTGIGLAIVKKASERMEGSVGVESEVNHGSRFWMTLQKNTKTRQP